MYRSTIPTTEHSHGVDGANRLDALSRRLNAIMALTADELAHIRWMQSAERTIPAHNERVRGLMNRSTAYVLRRGWACSYRMFPDGRRQIIDVAIPGDILGLRGMLPDIGNVDLMAVTDITIAEIPGSRMLEAFALHPRVASVFMWGAARDGANLVEHLIDIGRRSALARTAHFVLELQERLRIVGMATDAGFACPLNQYTLSDVLGLSAIHLNRVLRQLRETGCLTFRHGHMDVRSRQRLMAQAEDEGGALARVEDSYSATARASLALVNSEGLAALGIEHARVAALAAH